MPASSTSAPRSYIAHLDSAARWVFADPIEIDIEIEDVSLHGLRFRADRAAKAGERVRIGFPIGLAAVAQVCWATDEFIACRFLLSIAQADLIAFVMHR